MPLITFKRIIITAVVLAGFAIIINILSDIISNGEDEYISKNYENIQYKDVKEYLAKVNFSTGNNSDLFRNSAVNKYTLKFFKYMQEKFKTMNFDEHVEAVRQYLYSAMDSREADELFELYKKYLEYEKRVAIELNNAGELNTTGDMLRVLRKMKSLQYEFFGDKNAEIIFGAMMKAREYPIRRGGIVNDDSLYASEKQKLLEKLNSDMWGNEGTVVEKARKPYVTYTETLTIYSKDMSEMSEKQKQDKLTEIRKSIFPPDVVLRLEAVDVKIEAEKERDAQYQEDYNDIMNRNDISSDEKNYKIKELQNKIYGEDAESIRRIENIIRNSEELKKNYNVN